MTTEDHLHHSANGRMSSGQLLHIDEGSAKHGTFLQHWNSSFFIAHNYLTIHKMATAFSSLPIVDLSALKHDNPGSEALADLSGHLHNVFATTGFAYLVNSPLSFSPEDVFGMASEFFSLPEESKMSVAKRSFNMENRNTYRGYDISRYVRISIGADCSDISHHSQTSQQTTSRKALKSALQLRSSLLLWQTAMPSTWQSQMYGQTDISPPNRVSNNSTPSSNAFPPDCSPSLPCPWASPPTSSITT